MAKKKGLALNYCTNGSKTLQRVLLRWSNGTQGQCIQSSFTRRAVTHTSSAQNSHRYSCRAGFHHNHTVQLQNRILVEQCNFKTMILIRTDESCLAATALNNLGLSYLDNWKACFVQGYEVYITLVPPCGWIRKRWARCKRSLMDEGILGYHSYGHG